MYMMFDINTKRTLKKSKNRLFVISLSFLQFFEPDKNQFPFSPPWKNSRSSLLFSLFHLSLSSASSTVRPVQFHLFLSLTAFVVYFICFFFRLSYRPSEHKAEASHHSFGDIHHPSTQIFNKTSTASATQPLLCSPRRCASRAVLNISSHL